MRAYKRLAIALFAVFAVAGALSASAFASSAPTATTGAFVHEAAISGLELENIVYGTVNPNGLETTYYFEYGLTNSYGSRTSSQKAGSGTKTEEAGGELAIGKASSVYHYRIVATNADGTSYGADRVTAPKFTKLGRFTGKSSGVVVIGLGNGDKFSCSGATISGEVVSETGAHVAMELTGCGGGATCSNVGTGEVETKPLLGELGWITPGKAGLRLFGEKNGEFASYKCNWGAGLESTIKISRSVIAPIRNSASKEALIYNFEQSEGKPSTTEFEGGLVEDGLEANSSGYVSFSSMPYAFATELSLSGSGGILQVE